MAEDKFNDWDDIDNEGVDTEESSDEMYEHFSVVVDKGQAMLRLDKYLVDRMEHCSRSRIQTAADNGNILVNGTPV